MFNNKQYFFISGLPRSGSTLLSSILSQNPKCYTGIASSTGSLVDSLIYADFLGTNHNVTDLHIKKLVKAVFDTIYEDTPNEIIFDTNRMWSANIDMLHDIFPNTKMIMCVRSIVEILNSFENVYRKKLYSRNAAVYGNRIGTVHARCESLMDWDGVVGYSLNGLKQAFHSKSSHCIYLLEYHSLVNNTEFEIKSIYDFLGIAHFNHNFNSLPQVSDGGCDAEVNMPGLHTVHPKVIQTNNHLFLPHDIIERYSNMEYWRRFYDNNEPIN